MSANSSSSHIFAHLYSNCFNSSTVILTFVAFFITNIILLVPISVLIFYLGVQRWRRQRSMSHSDLFTYHMVGMELIGILGCSCSCYGVYTGSHEVLMWGIFVCSVILAGHAHFHILTCAERHLAVVHPVTYLSLRTDGGIRLRNITVGCVWLLCFGWASLVILFDPDFPIIPFFCLFAFTLIVVCFCSVSVLCVLIRPGPRDVSRDRERVDQSKHRAFYTIIAIMGVLMFKFGGLIVCTGISLGMGSNRNWCVLLTSAFWLCLPSSLVLPLLFLHRAGKLACCQSNTARG